MIKIYADTTKGRIVASQATPSVVQLPAMYLGDKIDFKVYLLEQVSEDGVQTVLSYLEGSNYTVKLGIVTPDPVSPLIHASAELTYTAATPDYWIGTMTLGEAVKDFLGASASKNGNFEIKVLNGTVTITTIQVGIVVKSDGLREGVLAPSSPVLEGIGTVGTLADVREIPTTGLVADQCVFVSGHTITGDGGEGSFFWDATSTAADDNGSVVLPTGRTLAGRWRRLIESGSLPSPEWFGGFATAVLSAPEKSGPSVTGLDCRAAVQACLVAYQRCHFGADCGELSAYGFARGMFLNGLVSDNGKIQITHGPTSRLAMLDAELVDKDATANPAFTLLNVARTGGVVTANTTVAHTLTVGNTITVVAVDTTFSASAVTVLSASGSTFTYTQAGAEVTVKTDAGTVTVSGQTQLPWWTLGTTSLAHDYWLCWGPDVITNADVDANNIAAPGWIMPHECEIRPGKIYLNGLHRPTKYAVTPSAYGTHIALPSAIVSLEGWKHTFEFQLLPYFTPGRGSAPHPEAFLCFPHLPYQHLPQAGWYNYTNGTSTWPIWGVSSSFTAQTGSTFVIGETYFIQGGFGRILVTNVVGNTITFEQAATPLDYPLNKADTGTIPNMTCVIRPDNKNDFTRWPGHRYEHCLVEGPICPQLPGDWGSSYTFGSPYTGYRPEISIFNISGGSYTRHLFCDNTFDDCHIRNCDSWLGDTDEQRLPVHGFTAAGCEGVKNHNCSAQGTAVTIFYLDAWVTFDWTIDETCYGHDIQSPFVFSMGAYGFDKSTSDPSSQMNSVTPWLDRITVRGRYHCVAGAGLSLIYAAQVSATSVVANPAWGNQAQINQLDIKAEITGTGAVYPLVLGSYGGADLGNFRAHDCIWDNIYANGSPSKPEDLAICYGAQARYIPGFQWSNNRNRHGNQIPLHCIETAPADHILIHSQQTVFNDHQYNVSAAAVAGAYWVYDYRAWASGDAGYLPPVSNIIYSLAPIVDIILPQAVDGGDRRICPYNATYATGTLPVGDPPIRITVRTGGGTVTVKVVDPTNPAVWLTLTTVAAGQNKLFWPQVSTGNQYTF